MTVQRTPFNILITVDRNYLPYFNIMLYSLLQSNPEEIVEVYLLHNSLDDKMMEPTQRILGSRGHIHLLKIEEIGLDDAPTTDRYPKEIYYRIFAAKYLPNTLERILYLDPDLIVNGSLRELYDMPMETAFFAAASHIGNVLHFINEVRLNMDEEMPYINSGVMLINLQQLRKEQTYSEVFAYINDYKARLILPDQDIISGLYGNRIIPLDPYRYNMTERLFMFHKQGEDKVDIDFIRKNSVIIHYCGRNKPWKSGYIGKLNAFYEETVSRMRADKNLLPAIAEVSIESP